MQNLIPSTTSLSIAKSDDYSVRKVVFKVNFLVSFPLSDSQIEDWTSEITRLSPHTTIQDLVEIIDKFMKNEYIWDNRIGIQNLFKAIKETDYENNKKKRKLFQIWEFEAKPLGISFEEYLAVKLNNQT
tara:strand:+ start:295 stop:681 length:387 start_codon:yes stop_codon:yes gene_type:complete